MKRKFIIEILKNDNYSEETIKSILVGRRRPNANRRYEYEKKYGIPFHIWGKNIKSYFQDNRKRSECE